MNKPKRFMVEYFNHLMREIESNPAITETASQKQKRKEVESMDTYRLYNHTVKESELLDMIRNAARHGYTSQLVINGEFYDIQVKNLVSACSACSDGTEDPDIPF